MKKQKKSSGKSKEKISKAKRKKEKNISEKQIQDCQEQFITLKEKTTLLRKSGKNTFTADMLLKALKAKVRLLKAYDTEKEFAEVKKLLNKAASEVMAIEKEKNTDIAKEVRAVRNEPF
ncbi:hypothetical protein C4573_00140 [Candidatus Woesearchaeota archaeon]|nr:MAG: hypothetical protein C4573_00140 [Candidatus Woesearchaeota archaeon]